MNARVKLTQAQELLAEVAAELGAQVSADGEIALDDLTKSEDPVLVAVADAVSALEDALAVLEGDSSDAASDEDSL